MLFSSRNHAIGMAHYQIAGGYKSLALMLCGYLAIMLLIIGMLTSNARDINDVLRGVATLMLILEGLVLVVIGALRIAGSIRLDYTSNMIESHRQMPVSAARAVTSYLMGATAHILALCAVHVLILGLLFALTSISFERLVLAQIVLAAFALFIWTFAAMGTMASRQAIPLMILVFIFGGCAGSLLRGWGMLPGITLLGTPFLGETIFAVGPLRFGRGILEPAYPVALAAQAAFSALFFLGACRRYRGTYLTTFNVPMGLALVTVWGVLSALAIHLWPTLTNSFTREFDQPTMNAQIVAALCGAALLGIVPTHALAVWENQHPVKWRLRLLTLAGIVVTEALVLACDPDNAGRWGVTLLVLATHVVTVYAALRLLARCTPMTMALGMGALLFGLWGVPLLMEFVRYYILLGSDGDMGRGDFTLLSTFSPLGVLMATWRDDPSAPPVWVGVACHLGLAGVLWQWAARRNRRAEAEPTVPPPQSAPS